MKVYLSKNACQFCWGVFEYFRNLHCVFLFNAWKI